MDEYRNDYEMNEENEMQEMNKIHETNETNEMNGLHETKEMHEVDEMNILQETLTEVTSSDKEETAKNDRTKKRRKHKRNGPVQVVLIALVSSMLGASAVFAAISIVPSAFHTGGSTDSSIQSSLNATGVSTFKNVTIEQSSSPVTAIAEKVGPSVVGIKVTTAPQQGDFFFATGSEGDEGSGIIISEDGYILTNNHVIEAALDSGTNNISSGAKIEIVLPNQLDKPYTAKVVGRDSNSDLAVLKIQATGLPKAELGDSDKLKAGELAVAIGNPGGLDYMGSVTAGIISGLNRTLTTDTGDDLHLIQTDAAINPGNSGGALCNSAGQVIGINTAKIAATGFEGLGFAIPINNAKQIAQDLINYKYVKGRPLLGLSIDQRFTPDIADSNNVPEGLLVADVSTYGPAQKAGIQTGDIITKFDGKAVKTFSDLDNQKNTHKPGDKVNVEVYRNGKTLTLTITLGEQTT